MLYLNGFFLSVWVQWWQVDKISPIKLYDENKTIAGFQLRHLLHKQGQHQYVKEIMNKLIKLYSDGKIRPCIDSAWAFEDVRNVIVPYGRTFVFWNIFFMGFVVYTGYCERNLK